MKLLKRIYDIHDQFASEYPTACRQGCSACCTCNVTATTLEGLLIIEHLRTVGRLADLDALKAPAPRARFQPKMTINRMAALCARGEDLPEEVNEVSAGRCFLLVDDCCAIYPARPFGCRAMVSMSSCIPGGEAQMPPTMLAVNNVIMQYIEAVDQPGASGNLIDILAYLSIESHRQSYLSQTSGRYPGPLLTNQPMPVLMVPPEHRQAIQPLIQTLNEAVQKFNSDDAP